MARITIVNVTAQAESSNLHLVVREGKKKDENKYVLTDKKYNPVFGSNKLAEISEYLEDLEIQTYNAQEEAEGLTDLSEVEELAQAMIEELETETEEAAGEEEITQHTYNGFDFEVIRDRNGDYTFSVVAFETEIECIRPYATEYGILQHARNQIDDYKEWVERCEDEAGGGEDDEESEHTPATVQACTDYQGGTLTGSYKGFDVVVSYEEGIGYCFTYTSDTYHTPNVKRTGYQTTDAAINDSKKSIDTWLESGTPSLYYQCVVNALQSPIELLNNSHPMPDTQFSLIADWRILDPHEDPAPYCDIAQTAIDAHQVTIDRWHQVSLELGAIGLGGESPDWETMSMSERLAYQERRLINAQMRISLLYRIHQSKQVYAAIKDTMKAITNKMYKDAQTIWKLIPANLRTDAKAILNNYRQDVTRTCNSFAEMVKATRLIDSLPG